MAGGVDPGSAEANGPRHKLNGAGMEKWPRRLVVALPSAFSPEGHKYSVECGRTTEKSMRIGGMCYS